jgi:hypothetical protein
MELARNKAIKLQQKALAQPTEAKKQKGLKAARKADIEVKMANRNRWLVIEEVDSPERSKIWYNFTWVLGTHNLFDFRYRVNWSQFRNSNGKCRCLLSRAESTAPPPLGLD